MAKPEEYVAGEARESFKDRHAKAEAAREEAEAKKGPRQSALQQLVLADFGIDLKGLAGADALAYLYAKQLSGK